MNFLRDKSGTSTVEWLVIAVIIVAVVGGILLTLFDTIQSKLTDINDAL